MKRVLFRICAWHERIPCVAQLMDKNQGPTLPGRGSTGDNATLGKAANRKTKCVTKSEHSIGPPSLPSVGHFASPPCITPQIGFFQGGVSAISETRLGCWKSTDLTAQTSPRHSAATIALATGVSPKVVSEQLVHASTAFTLDTYACHALMIVLASTLIASNISGISLNAASCALSISSARSIPLHNGVLRKLL